MLAAILTGLLSGVFYTGAQSVKVVPIILEAETYEHAGAHSHEAATPAHEHSEDAWAPADGMERLFYSLLSNSIVGVAYALLLMAAMLFSGQPVSLRAGILWGIAGFAVFVLAPGLGLPPEVPGTVAAPVPIRQAWWFATVILTAGGLALLASQTRWFLLVAGVVMIAAPHIYGAPEPVHHASLAPANLAAEFVVAAIVTAGLFWIFLGGVLGWMLERLALDQETS